MKNALWLVFLATVATAAVFTMVTDRAWEDWFITYRHSRNLALGQGLVYQPGERVHGFTSPLGTLVPALTCLLSGDTSEDLALWLYRLTTIPALGLACAGLVWVGWRQGMSRSTLVLLAGLLAWDAKTVDFTTNGMETGYLLAFLSLTMVCLQLQSWPGLGVAWAGLMWTRPDGFVYIAATAFADLAWGDERRRRLGIALRAALLCTVLYLPWFAGAWYYYGSPVPHTVKAKAQYHSVPQFLAFWVRSARTLTRAGGPVAGVFEPAYTNLGGWPAWIHGFSLALTVLALGQALLPGPRAARAAGLAFALVLAYYIGVGVAPWYLPPGAALGYLSFAWAFERLARRRPRLGWIVAVALLAVQVYLLVRVGQQAGIVQRCIERGVRRPIGEWLRANAGPHDRVMVESLGYIGYYSGMKMLDMPGLVSPEVVEARRLHGEFAGPIRALQPEWVVLRTVEINLVNQQDPQLLKDDYRVARAYDALPELQKLGVFPGWGAAVYDSQYTVFQRRR